MSSLLTDMNKRCAVSLVGLVALGACGAFPKGVERAHRLMAAGDYRQAERVAETELARHPKHPVLWRIKIQAPIELGDSARAVKRYRQWHELRKHYDNKAMRAMAIATLDRALHSADARLRRAAVGAVAAMSVGRLRRSVVRLLSDRDDTVAATAALALLPRDKRAAPAARRLLESTNARARALAVTAVAGKLEHLDVGLTALADASPQVRRAAASALARFGARAHQPLVRLATSDHVGSVRATAFSALARAKVPDSAKLAGVALRDKYVGSRLAAIALLSKAGKAGRSQLLALTKTADAFVAIRAAVALRYLGGERRPDAVERALNSSDWTVRSAALNALAEVSEPADAVRLAKRALTDPRAEVRLTAARSLARSGMPGEAMAVFQTALGSARESIRLRAAAELLRLDEGSGRRALAKLLHSKNVATRIAAVHVYARAENATLTLVDALADKAAGVRLAAAESLMRLLR